MATQEDAVVVEARPTACPRARSRLGLPALCFGIGFVGALLICSLAGTLLTRRDIFDDFQRFNGFIAPDSYFYPTAREVRAIAYDHLDRSKINVIVGGSSVMYGVGQPSGRTWVDHLRAELGPNYRVLNLAMRGGDVTGLASFTAEMLIREGYRVVYVTDIGIGTSPQLTGSAAYEYFYWDAKYNGFLLPWAPRDEVIGGRARLREIAVGEWLNSFLHFDDLWTTVAYRWLGTVFTTLAPTEFWKPRRFFADPEIDPPPELRYRNIPANLSLFTAITRGTTPDTWPRFQRALETALPDSLRRVTVVSVCENSPGVTSLAAEDVLVKRAADRFETMRRLKAVGAHPVLSCDGFDKGDYIDRVHLSVSGAGKIALRLGRAVRALAAERWGE